VTASRAGRRHDDDGAPHDEEQALVAPDRSRLFASSVEVCEGSKVIARRLRPLVAVAIAALLGGARPSYAEAPSEPVPPTAPTVTAPESPTVAEPNAGATPDGAAGDATSTPAKKRRPAKERPGGINPCMTPDPGFGLYDGWSRAISMGQLLAPKRGGVTKSGAFDLLIHFHGHEPIRKEFVKSASGIVLVGIDLGIGSGAYSSAFATPQAFERLLESIRQEMARRTGRADTTIRRLGLSSWSAGYGAIQQILRQPAGAKVDSVVLLDSLHAGYQDGSSAVAPLSLEPFVAFAQKAARGQKFLFQSYSSIVPPGYASTREVAHFLVERLGGRVRRTKRADVLGLAMDERFDRGNYHVRGYLGDDKPDHCAHLGLIKDVVRSHLNRRWAPPKALPEPRRTLPRTTKGTSKTANKERGVGRLSGSSDRASRPRTKPAPR